MAVIKSGAGTDQLTIDATSKAARATLYTPNGDSCMDEANDAARVNIVAGSASISGTVTATGNVAHAAADSGNPVKTGGRARTTDITAVTTDARVDSIYDTLGKQIVLPGSSNDLRVSGTTNYTNNSAADVIATIASTRIVVTGILVTNAHATVSTKVTIRDGTTAKIVGYAAAIGGGFELTAGGTPIFIGASGAAITAICGTSGADVDVSIFGYKITN